MYEMEGPRLAAPRLACRSLGCPALRAPAGASHPLEPSGFPAVSASPGSPPSRCPSLAVKQFYCDYDLPAQGLQDTKSMIL